LGQRGANVVVNYTSPRGQKAGAEVIKIIEDDGAKATLVQANVGIISELERLVEAALALSETGKLDILVHNAASGDDAFLEDMTEEFFDTQTAINLKGKIYRGRKGLLGLCDVRSDLPH